MLGQVINLWALDRDQLSGLARPFFAIFAILFVGAATAFYRYWMEPGAELMLIVGLWTTFNLVIAGAALGVVAERKVSDRFPRLVIDRRGRLDLGGTTADVVVTSVSAGGCSLRFVNADVAPARFEKAARCSLTILPLEDRAVQTPLFIDVVHQTLDEDGTTFGFSFGTRSAATHMALADLMYGDPDAMLRFIAKRRHHKGIFAGSLQFLRWGLSEPLRAMTYGLRRATTKVTAPDIVAAEIVAPQVVVAEALDASTVAVALETRTATIDTSTMTVSLADFLDGADVHPLAIVEEPSLAELTTADTAFDSLMSELVETAANDEEIGITADWLSALLTLAAEEMRRASAAENGAHVAA